MSASSTSSCFLQLPGELILSVLDHLPELDLLRLRQVSSTLRILSLSVLLGRHGIREAQIQNKEPLKVSYTALHALDASYPALLTDLRHLEVDFTSCPWEDRRGAWNALGQLARRFPPIENVSLSLATPRTPASLNKFIIPEALVALLGAPTHPIVIIQHLYATIVRPRRNTFLERAWNSVHPRTANNRRIDQHQLAQKLQFSLAASTSLLHVPLSSICIHSFLEPSAALGSFLVVNPSNVVYLKLAEDEITPAEWSYLLPQLSLPCLRTLSIDIDLHDLVLTPFLERHVHIERLDLSRDWVGLALKSSPTFALQNLSHFSASCRVVASLLRTSERLPRLSTVSMVLGGEAANDSTSVNDVLDVLAEPSRSSVTALTIHLDSLSLPWRNETQQKKLWHIKELRIVGWRPDIDMGGTDCNLAPWLLLFPTLGKLTIAGKLDYSLKGPLVSKELVAAIAVTSPKVLVMQERYV